MRLRRSIIACAIQPTLVRRVAMCNTLKSRQTEVAARVQRIFKPSLKPPSGPGEALLLSCTARELVVLMSLAGVLPPDRPSTPARTHSSHSHSHQDALELLLDTCTQSGNCLDELH